MIKVIIKHTDFGTLRNDQTETDKKQPAWDTDVPEGTDTYSFQFNEAWSIHKSTAVMMLAHDIYLVNDVCSEIYTYMYG